MPAPPCTARDGGAPRLDAAAEEWDARAIFERFTDRARRVLVLAQEEARLLDHSFIGTEHVLLGLLSEGEGLAAKALEGLGIDLLAARAKVADTIGPAGAAPAGSPPFTPRTKKVLELALREALQLGHNYIGTEHLLLGIVREGEGVAAQVLLNLGANLPNVRAEVMRLLTGRAGGGRPAARDEGHRSDGEPPGETWSARVVRAGRAPASFAEAYDVLAAIARRLGVDLDDERIKLQSIETSEGPGLLLSVDHAHLGPAEAPAEQPDA